MTRLLVSILCFLFLSVQSNGQNWSKSYSFSGSYTYPYEAIGVDNGVVIVGAIDTGSVNRSYHNSSFVLKTDFQGDSVWHTSIYVPNKNTVLTRIVEMPNKDFIVTGYVDYDSDSTLIVRLDSAGTILSTNFFVGVKYPEVFVTPDSGYVVYGLYDPYVGYNGADDFRVVRYSLSDQIVWDKKFGPLRAYVDYSALYSRSRIFSGRSPMSGDYLFAFSSITSDGINSRSALFEIDSLGNQVSSNVCLDPLYQKVSGLVVEDSCFYVSGLNGVGSMTPAPFVIKLDQYGDTIWNRSAPSADAGYLMKSSYGGVMFNCSDYSFSPGKLYRFSSNGDTTWSYARYGIDDTYVIEPSPGAYVLVYRLGATSFEIAGINDPSLEHNDILISDIYLYPNPSGDIVIVNGVSSFEYEILDSSGKVLLIGKSTNIIDVSTLGSGVYLLRLKDSNNTQHSLKFIKE